MTDYWELPIYIVWSILKEISPGQGKVKQQLFIKDGSEGLDLTLHDPFYLPNSLCNLVNLARLNNSGIFYNNEYKNLYNVKTRQVLARALW